LSAWHLPIDYPLKDGLMTIEIILLDTMGVISLKNAKALVGSQITVEDLPFSQQNPTVFLHKKILYHLLDTKRPWHRLWATIFIMHYKFNIISKWEYISLIID